MPKKERETSGTVLFASGDAGTAKDVLDLRDEETFRVTDITVSYSNSGSTEASFALYDNESGTASGDVDDKFEEQQISPGDFESVTGISRRDIEADIVAVVTNNDADVNITVGGEIVTG